MKKFPYFKINQLGTEFIVTKMSSDYLIEHVDFEFRFPYRNSSKDVKNAEKYIIKLSEKTNDFVSIKERKDGIQRRTDLGRIEKIADHIEKNGQDSLIFPTPLVLGVNLYTEIDFEEKESVVFNNDNTLSFPEDKTIFTIIDGQHRLLGIARYREKYGRDISKLELPVMLIPEVDLAGATKIFIDINANQRKVNKSVVYDLYDNIQDEEYNYIKSIKAVVQALNENKESVLYNQIKMLGVGDGRISLAFMIDYIESEILKKQPTFNQVKLLKSLNDYLSIFKKTFPDLWETLFSKTTGMGALLMYYPLAVERFGNLEDPRSLEDLRRHLEDVSIDTSKITGTGKKAQKHVFDQINLQ